MPKITLQTISNNIDDNNTVQKINENFDAVEAALDQFVSRDGTEPNFMDADLDANGNQIINLGTPTAGGHAASKSYVDGLAALQTSINALTDVDTETAAPTAGQVFTWDGTNWVPDDLPAAAAETDPVFSAHPSFGIGSADITNWNTAYGWGDHAAAGYLTSAPTINPLDLEEIAEPAAPAANTLRLYSVDYNGITHLEYKNADGDVVRLARDSLVLARNTSGTTMNPGEVVYISGSTGQTPNIAKYIADGSLMEERPLGLIHDVIANNGFGHVMVLGRLNGVDTSAWAEGDRLYASATVAGAIATTIPSHPNLRVVVGTVARSHVNQGSIIVQPISIRGDHTGTRSNTWYVGDGQAGAKAVQFVNSAGTITLEGTPTGSTTLTLPTTSGTVALVGAAGGQTIRTYGAAWVSDTPLTNAVNEVVLSVPKAGTIASWTAIGDQQGSATIDVRKKALGSLPAAGGDSICGGAKPTITTARTGTSSSLGAWTTSVSAGDTLTFVLESTSTFNRLTFQLFIEEYT